jgi:prepilin-type N-terminal cleavage/methylation domain-containing protein
MRRPAPVVDERGLTLMELVVAMSLFALVMAGVAASVSTGLNLTRTDRHRSVAANLASDEMDVVREADFTTLVPRTITQTVGGVNYSVRRDLTWVTKSSTTSPCDSSGSPQLLRVHVQVSWADMHGTKPVVSDSMLAPPVGAYDPNTGHIAVKVLDTNALPQGSAVVTINGPENKTLPTNTQGCAFFAFLTPGTYTVTLNTPGYVDRQSNATPTQTLGVTEGNISSVQFDYDRAANLVATIVPTAGGAPPDDLALTLANSQYLPNGQRMFTGTGTTRTVSDLFPSLEGYQAWVGECADADPEGIKIVGTTNYGPYWPGAARAAGVAPPAGGSATMNVAVPSAQLTVLNAAAAPVAGATVVATHAADNICGAGATHTLGVTDAAGQLTAALPYGTWTISVDGNNPATAWPELVLDPNATSTPALEVDVQ